MIAQRSQDFNSHKAKRNASIGSTKSHNTVQEVLYETNKQPIITQEIDLQTKEYKKQSSGENSSNVSSSANESSTNNIEKMNDTSNQSEISSDYEKMEFLQSGCITRQISEQQSKQYKASLEMDDQKVQSKVASKNENRSDGQQGENQVNRNKFENKNISSKQYEYQSYLKEGEVFNNMDEGRMRMHNLNDDQGTNAQQQNTYYQNIYNYQRMDPMGEEQVNGEAAMNSQNSLSSMNSQNRLNSMNSSSYSQNRLSQLEELELEKQRIQKLLLEKQKRLMNAQQNQEGEQNYIHFNQSPIYMHSEMDMMRQLEDKYSVKIEQIQNSFHLKSQKLQERIEKLSEENVQLKHEQKKFLNAARELRETETRISHLAQSIEEIQICKLIQEDLEVKSMNEVYHKVKNISKNSKQEKKFIFCIIDMVNNCSPQHLEKIQQYDQNGHAYDSGSNLKQAWKWLKFIMEDYVNLKRNHMTSSTNGQMYNSCVIEKEIQQGLSNNQSPQLQIPTKSDDTFVLAEISSLLKTENKYELLKIIQQLLSQNDIFRQQMTFYQNQIQKDTPQQVSKKRVHTVTTASCINPSANTQRSAMQQQQLQQQQQQLQQRALSPNKKQTSSFSSPKTPLNNHFNPPCEDIPVPKKQSSSRVSINISPQNQIITCGNEFQGLSSGGHYNNINGTGSSLIKKQQTLAMQPAASSPSRTHQNIVTKDIYSSRNNILHLSPRTFNPIDQPKIVSPSTSSSYKTKTTNISQNYYSNPYLQFGQI